MILRRMLKSVAGLGLLALAVEAQDQDLASLHQFNLLSQVRGKTRLMVHSRLRFYDNISDFFQFRAGPIIYHDWTKRLQLLAGYYVIHQRARDSINTIQRPWAGAQVRAYEDGKFSVDWRNLVERHVYSGPGDFTRIRTRGTVNVRIRAGWQPYASAEALALKGHVIGRYTAGVNYATESGHIFGVGYEFRQDVGKPGSHIIATVLQFQVAGPRRREKPGEAEAPQ